MLLYVAKLANCCFCASSTASCLSFKVFAYCFSAKYKVVTAATTIAIAAKTGPEVRALAINLAAANAYSAMVDDIVAALFTYLLAASANSASAINFVATIYLILPSKLLFSANSSKFNNPNLAFSINILAFSAIVSAVITPLLTCNACSSAVAAIANGGNIELALSKASIRVFKF